MSPPKKQQERSPLLKEISDLLSQDPPFTDTQLKISLQELKALHRIIRDSNWTITSRDIKSPKRKESGNYRYRSEITKYIEKCTGIVLPNNSSISVRFYNKVLERYNLWQDVVSD